MHRLLVEAGPFAGPTRKVGFESDLWWTRLLMELRPHPAVALGSRGTRVLEKRNSAPTVALRTVKIVLMALAVMAGLRYLLPLVGLEVSLRRVQVVDLEGTEIERLSPPARKESGRRPKNLVIVIGDGIGFSHLMAGRSVLHGIGGKAAWDAFSATGWHRSHEALGFVPDSASSATALASGEPTLNGRLGMDVQGLPIETLFERAAALGYRTGMVTDSYVWDATPAAFTSHAPSRKQAELILRQLADSSLELLVGELEDVGEEDVPDWSSSVKILEEGFRVYGPDAEGTQAFLKEARTGLDIAAIYEEDQLTDLDSTPPLPPFVEAALRRLSSDDRPFLLLVESEEPDSASHDQDFDRLVRGIAVIEKVLEVVLDHSNRDRETLVVFTGDHETGGLALGQADSENSGLEVLWSTWGHTGSAVPLLAIGPGSEHFVGNFATWEVGRLLISMLNQPSLPQSEKSLEENSSRVE